MITYFSAEWQLLYIFILVICWLCIDKLTIVQKYHYVLAIGLAIPTYIILVNIMGPPPSYAPELREIYFGGLNYTLISLVPGAIIGAVISIIKYIKEYITIKRMKN